MDLSSVSISERTVAPAVVNPDIISKKHSAYEGIAPEKYIGSAPNAVIMIHVRETMRVASFVPMFSSFLFHVKAIAIKETASIRIIVLRNPIMESYSSDETAMRSGTSITRAMKSMINARNRITDR